jgi:tRNA threonylcarbamoyladenosine dehydratase
MTRFIRTERLLGPEALERLRCATVAVVGMGAVGSYAVEGLTRSGVGALRLVDFDAVRSSNINRQLYALDSTVGRPKVEVARERVRDINPECAVDVRSTFVDWESAPGILDPAPDVLIDAIDSVGPKVALLATAVARGVATIAVMGAALRRDPSAIRVDDIAQTQGCPLARLIRRRLRRQGVSSGITCVYSIEPLPPRPAHAIPSENPDETPFIRGRPREPLGSMSTLTGIFGLWAATLAVERLIAGREEPVRAHISL